MEGQEGEGRDTRERQTGWRRRPSVPIRVHISELTYGNVLANRGGRTRTKKRGRSSVGWWGMGDGRLSANCPANMRAHSLGLSPVSPPQCQSASGTFDLSGCAEEQCGRYPKRNFRVVLNLGILGRRRDRYGTRLGPIPGTGISGSRLFN